MSLGGSQFKRRILPYAIAENDGSKTADRMEVSITSGRPP